MHHVTYRWARRIVVGLVGGTILLVGVALLVLPGPAFVVIPVGLGVLGLEFAWARHWLRQVRAQAANAINKVNSVFTSDRTPPG